MLTKQPKKSNNNIRYSIGVNPAITSQISGKALKKNRAAKQKLHKNLSQYPNGVLNESKQNASMANLMIPRPHSSLVGSDISRSLSRQKQRADLSSFFKDKSKLKKISSKRNTLSIVDVPMKMRRQSGTSHSNNKWNNRSVQEDPNLIKFMMAQNRKKYNLSCGDMIESKSKRKQISTAANQKKKKPSLAGGKNSGKNQSKKIINKNMENQNKKFKQINLGAKSKGSTAVINMNQTVIKGKKKEKQKENKENKKKRQRSKSKSKSKNKNKKGSKSNKMFVLYKGDSDQQKSIVHEPEYPINKYVDMKKKAKKSLNIRVGVDYNLSCLNFGSNSSGVINQQFSSSMQRNKQNILVANQEYQPSDSINVQQIKYYEEHSPIKNKQIGSVRLDRYRKLRNEILTQLQEEYPYLNSTQLNFLSSIVVIQRKWREFLLFKRLNQRKQIITQYLQEPQNSKQSKLILEKPMKSSGEKFRFGEKTQLSRTKIAQFQTQQQTKHQSKSKVKLEEQEQSQFSNQKNSLKKQVIIFSNEGSEQSKNNSKKDESQQMKDQSEGELTDRKPVTQNSKIVVNYSWIFSRQIFPEVNYLEYRKNLIRESFQKTLRIITQQRKNRKITDKEYEFRRNDLTFAYQKEIQQLKKTKHDIKKGYLKYIDCIHKIKQAKNSDTAKTDNRYGLRKVSSDSNFLSNLYQKIFKFDRCISQWSGGSESIEMLTKKILIRKQFFKQDKKSARKSLSDIRSAARSSYEFIRSSRDAQSNTVIVFQHTDRLINLNNSQKQSKDDDQENESKYIKQFKFSNEIFKSKQFKQEKQEYKQESESEQKLYQQSPFFSDRRNEQKVELQPLRQTSQQQNLAYVNKLTNSISLLHSQSSVNYTKLLENVESEVMLELAKQLQKDIHNINPILMDIILINQPESSDFQEIDDLEYQEKDPTINSIQRELQTLGSPRNAEQTFRVYESEMEPERVIEYLYSLIQFINSKKWASDILDNLNNNQTFQPLAYLKFLRDFEIPDEQYSPIINNQRFIQWQTYYSNAKLRENRRQERSNQLQIVQQSEAIFHRCVFQVFLAELERNRPYGQKGRPFPWQQKYSYITVRQVADEQLSQVIQKSIHKVQQYLIYKCGLITQKIFIGNEEQLERAHEQNEDRIIEMLEQDLYQTSHQWYEVEEHLLEIKLEISYIIEQMLFEETALAMQQIKR